MTEGALKALQEKQESFVIKYQEQLRFDQEARRAETAGDVGRRREMLRARERYERELKNEAMEILRIRQNLVKNHTENFQELQEVQQHVLDVKLVQWKRSQALQYNGGYTEDGQLKNIQQWCEALTELAWSNRQQIKRLEIQRTQLVSTNCKSVIVGASVSFQNLKD